MAADAAGGGGAQRVAKALQYATRGYRMSPAEELGQAVFAEEAVALGDAAQQLGNVVLVRDIEFYSTHKVPIPSPSLRRISAELHTSG
jgi:GTP cyclohydrolase I